MANAIFGMIEKHSGTIMIDGEEVTIATPEDAIAAGLAFVTEDRKQEGLFLNLSVKDNILSANLSEVERRLGFVNSKKESELAELGVKRLDVKPPKLHTLVKALSGGNQQKVIIARWLTKEVKILILDEPTRGIDVGAKQAIYEIMRDLTKQGIAILMISSELPEILGMSDRIAVMKDGRILQILDKEEASQQKIMTIITEG
jgi:ABC-type sugar transport system ATPase subunit